MFTTTPVGNSTPAPLTPEYFSLPKSGGDPWFNCTRSWYYAAEKAGLIRLVRIKQRGRIRGITRVPYDEVAKLFQAARK